MKQYRLTIKLTGVSAPHCYMIVANVPATTPEAARIKVADCLERRDYPPFTVLKSEEQQANEQTFLDVPRYVGEAIKN